MVVPTLLNVVLALVPSVVDGADADDDDEGEHDRVLDRGRAVLGLDELHDDLGELTHE